jgi:hypothetical protein
MLAHKGRVKIYECEQGEVLASEAKHLQKFFFFLLPLPLHSIVVATLVETLLLHNFLNLLPKTFWLCSIFPATKFSGKSMRAIDL